MTNDSNYKLKRATFADMSTLEIMVGDYYDIVGSDQSIEHAWQYLMPFLLDEKFGRVWMVYRDQSVVGYVDVKVDSLENLGVEGGGDTQAGVVDEMYLMQPWKGMGEGADVIGQLGYVIGDMSIACLLLRKSYPPK